MRAHVILLVDDEPEALATLRHALVDQSQVLTATSGEEALAILAEREVDLLLADQRMPGLSGIDLVERARRRSPELCAILLTGSRDPDELLDAVNRAGVYRYLVKPWDPTDLRHAVSRALAEVDLRRDRARLLAETERRLAALEAAAQIAREVGAAEGHGRLLERVLERLPRVVPCDAAAAILAVPGEPPALTIHPVAELSEAALLAVQADALAAYRGLAGVALDEGSVQVRVAGTGAGRTVSAFASRVTLPIQLAGAAAGVVLVTSERRGAFGPGDERILDLLVNDVAESLSALGARIAGERERLAHVVECMADGLLYAATGADEIVANPAARRLLGAPLEGRIHAAWLKQALGFYPFDLVRGQDADPGGTYVREDVRIGDRTLSSTVSAVVERDGRLAGVAVALRDVTEQKRLEERKEEIVQVVSHELRTPLTAITGALDVVLAGLAGDVVPKQSRYLTMARESVDRLNGVVDDLLDVARLARGKLEMTPEVVHLDELVRAALERYAPAAAERRQEIAIEAPPSPVRILGDAPRLGQVLSNLLTNAVKFTPDGGVIRVRILRAPDAVPGVAGFSVWNNGEGIAEPDLERIFEKFEQARSERTRRVRGTGLGLAISRGIVEAHGGAIWAESPPEGGARFTVVLPEAPPAGAEERGPLGDDAPAALVVDDPGVAPLACGVLRAAGIACRHVATAEEAIAAARRHRPALVLWDPLLPALQGLPLAEVLHHDADTRRAAVLALSTPEGREPAFRGGADAFVEKPAPAAVLAESTLALLGRGRSAGSRVLVVDDDPAIRTICAEVLRAHGYEVDEAGDCATARRLVVERRPQVLVVDVQLPDGDGFSLLEGLAEARAVEPFAAVFLSARGETSDKVRGLRLGADDYLTKPFDAQELVARVDAVVRRREAALHASPMTRLPGGRAIDREVQERIERGEPFALSYVDLDNLKAYNDTYGYAKADGVVLQTAGILRDAVARRAGEGAFLGHIGGDDFVLLSRRQDAATLCREVIALFDRVIPLYYDRADRERGYIEAVDRYGTRRRFGILSLSIATVVALPGRFRDHAELARTAAALKERAKRIPGSVHLLDDAGAAA